MGHGGLDRLAVRRVGERLRAGTENTTWAWAPPVPGNFWSRRLRACWDWVPGMVSELLVGCLTLIATTASTAITTTHPAST